MSRVECFMIVPVPVALESLRRFVFNSKCSSPWGYHTASIDIGEVPWTDPKFSGRGDIPSEAQKMDPRWPKTCACGYAFVPGDEWQHNFDQLYVREGTDGPRFQTRSAPPGAMWRITYYEENIKEWCGPDGKALCVMLPDGQEWHIDGPAKGGGKWTRTGEAPKVTVNPSILTSGYHGFLRAGFLESC